VNPFSKSVPGLVPVVGEITESVPGFTNFNAYCSGREAIVDVIGRDTARGVLVHEDSAICSL